MREQGTTAAAFYVMPILAGSLVYLLARLFGLSHMVAMGGALLSAWYFHRTAQKLHFAYFRDERLGHKITVKARFDFLFGLGRLLVCLALLPPAVFLTAGVLGFRLGMRLILSALIAVLCHLILPWVFVLSADSHRRGRRLLTYDEAEVVAEKNLPAGESGVLWGGIKHPAYELTQSHFLAVGVTRSGKTLTIRRLMQSVIPLIGVKPEEKPLAHRGTRYRALFYDPKNDMLPILHPLAKCRVVLIQPWDLRGHAWRLRDDIGTDFGVALEIASCLFPKEEGEKHPFFSEARMALAAGGMTSFGLSGGEWTLLDFCIAFRTREGMQELLERHPETRHLVEQYFKPEDTFQNILATLANRMAVFEPIAHLWAEAEKEGKSVSIKEWLEGDLILTLGNDDSRRIGIDALIQAFFGSIASLLLRPDKPAGERNLVFLDELREAGKLPGLRRLLNKGLGEGTTVVGAFTDIHGLETQDAYGEKEAREMLAQFSNKAVLRLESDATSSWAAANFGDVERWEYPVSEAEEGKQNTREELVKRESILPSQFLEIPPTNPENGLTGYYLSPAIGAFRATLPWSFAFEELIPPAPPAVCPKFIKREIPAFVAGWDADDLKRLCIEPSLIQGASPSNEVRQEQDGQKDGASDKPEVVVLKRKDARRQSGS